MRSRYSSAANGRTHLLGTDELICRERTPCRSERTRVLCFQGAETARTSANKKALRSWHVLRRAVEGISPPFQRDGPSDATAASRQTLGRKPLVIRGVLVVACVACRPVFLAVDISAAVRRATEANASTVRGMHPLVAGAHLGVRPGRAFGVRRLVAAFSPAKDSSMSKNGARPLPPVEKGCHCWLVQQCMGIMPARTRLGKPAVSHGEGFRQGVPPDRPGSFCFKYAVPWNRAMSCPVASVTLTVQVERRRPRLAATRYILRCCYSPMVIWPRPISKLIHTAAAVTKA